MLCVQKKGDDYQVNFKPESETTFADAGRSLSSSIVPVLGKSKVRRRSLNSNCPLHTRDITQVRQSISRAECTMLRRLYASLGDIGGLNKYALSSIGRRFITSSTSTWQKKMPDRPPLVNEEEFTESFLKGSGPGGQKIVRFEPIQAAT